MLPTTLLLPIIEKGQPSRIVNVSASGSTVVTEAMFDLDKMNDPASYSCCTSIASIIMFSNALTRKLAERGVNNVYVNSVHPDFVRSTNVTHNMNWIPRVLFTSVRYFNSISPKQGAATSLYVATSPDIIEKGRGQYFIPLGQLDKSSDLIRDTKVQDRLWEFTESLIHKKIGYIVN